MSEIGETEVEARGHRCNPHRFGKQRAGGGGRRVHAYRVVRAAQIGQIQGEMPTGEASTSWMFGSSRSSAKTNTPGAEVASWISFAAPAPLADLDISRKGSSFATKLVPSSAAMACEWREGEGESWRRRVSGKVPRLSRAYSLSSAPRSLPLASAGLSSMALCML